MGSKEPFTSVFINLAVILQDDKASATEKGPVIQRKVRLISGGENYEEVLYELVITTGTIISDDIESVRKGVKLGVVQAASYAPLISAQLYQIAAEIASTLAI